MWQWTCSWLPVVPAPRTPALTAQVGVMVGILVVIIRGSSHFKMPLTTELIAFLTGSVYTVMCTVMSVYTMYVCLFVCTYV